jgi:hypothetical protein
MVPDIAYHLIQEDIRAIYDDDYAFDYATIERIIAVTAHLEYKMVRVKLDDDE